MAIYMKYKGGAVKGDVTEDGHKEWILLKEVKWGVGRGIRTPVGNTVNREAKPPSVSEIKVKKWLDAGSTSVLTEALIGEGADCEIHLCKTEKDKLVIYLSLTLTNTMISSYSLETEGDKPVENLALNFTKIEFKNFPMDSTGNVGNADPITYDIGLAKKV